MRNVKLTFGDGTVWPPVVYFQDKYLIISSFCVFCNFAIRQSAIQLTAIDQWLCAAGINNGNQAHYRASARQWMDFMKSYSINGANKFARYRLMHVHVQYHIF